jgi:phosphoribosyl 1,2-cyclic phosphodiesterase
MYVLPLQSDSSGNSIYVEQDGTGVLFDAGISGRSAETRLAAHGRSIRDVTAVVISHDHRDHIACAGVYQRKFGLPLYISEKTFAAADPRCRLGRLRDVRHFRAGEGLEFPGLVIDTIPTPHDGVDGTAFTVTAGGRRLGILTDLGHPFAALRRILPTLDGVVLESNYEPGMLANGPYPLFLRERIRGPGGHLSNVEAADLVRVHGQRLVWVCLAHLSGENNTPDTALATHRRIARPQCDLHVLARGKAGHLLQL